MKKIILVASAFVAFSLVVPGVNAQGMSNDDTAALEATLMQLLETVNRLQKQVEQLQTKKITSPGTVIPPDVMPRPAMPALPDFAEPEFPKPAKPVPAPKASFPEPVPPIGECRTFETNMGVGASGPEVAALHAMLHREGFSTDPFQYEFTEETAAAVSGFQGKYATEILHPLGLKNSTGYVGKGTRAKLNALYGCAGKPISKPEPPKPAGKITVTSPNGGESWNANVKNFVTWKIEPSIEGNVHFYFLEEFANGVWKPMLWLGSAPATQGAWVFPNYPLGGTKKYKLRASTDPAEFGVCTWKNVEHPIAKWCLEGTSAPRVFDDSDAPFLYTSPDSSSRPLSLTLDLVSPRSADGVPRTEEKWQAGSVKQIEWTYFGSLLPKDINIYLLPSEAFWRNAQEAPYAHVAGPLSNQQRWTNIVAPNPGAAFGKDISPSDTYVLLLCEGDGPRAPECKVGDTSVGIYISSSPAVTKPSTAGPKISKLTPSSGPVGTQVTITGSGLGGKIMFGDGIVLAHADTDIHYSKDGGKTLTFFVPGVIGPACLYQYPPCEMVPPPTAPGTYAVVVINDNGKSNPATFTVTEGKAPSAEYPAVKVTEPSRGDTLVIGEPAVAIWNSVGKAVQFDVYLFPAGYVSEFDERRVVIAKGLPGDYRGYKFIVPKVAVGKYEIVVR